MTVYSSLLQSLPGIAHGFGDKSALMPDNLAAWQSTLPQKKQVHGSEIGLVSHAGQACGEVDGLITFTPGVLLTVLTADCLPLLFCRRDGQAIGVVHAGWRGLLAGIIEQFARLIAAQGNHPADWLAVVGPAAGPCCYEVGHPLVADFCRQLTVPTNIITPGNGYLDLPAIAAYKLQQAGFGQSERLNECTICSQPSTASASQAGPACFSYTSFRRNSKKRATDRSYPSIKGRNQHSGLIMLPKTSD
ncbi:polyphenol oxidase family protein [Biostraticola tofi]|uniref:YfiH family protein n=1 Tax=Biostraticola tofi TaxID=466109 RepID=A0A4R3Z2H5_9GAMM|nr:polyphenol oxidase family protein [Biostraticola tofi]TCV99991.1 YfiH family protein [Biostraticola tofi]